MYYVFLMEKLCMFGRLLDLLIFVKLHFLSISVFFSVAQFLNNLTSSFLPFPPFSCTRKNYLSLGPEKREPQGGRGGKAENGREGKSKEKRQKSEGFLSWEMKRKTWIFPLSYFFFKKWPTFLEREREKKDILLFDPKTMEEEATTASSSIV